MGSYELTGKIISFKLTKMSDEQWGWTGGDIAAITDEFWRDFTALGDNFKLQSGELAQIGDVYFRVLYRDPSRRCVVVTRGRWRSIPVWIVYQIREGAALSKNWILWHFNKWGVANSPDGLEFRWRDIGRRGKMNEVRIENLAHRWRKRNAR